MAVVLAGLLLLSGHMTPVGAQDATGTVTGRVMQAESDQPLPSVMIQLHDAADSTAVRSTASGFDGRFRLAGLEPGAYYLEISSLGFGSRTTEAFDVERDMIYDLGVIPLSSEAVALEPITVVASRPVVEHEADRTAYAVDGMHGAEGGAVTDALQLVPDLDVDLDGNVELRGERPAIWVDGRPAPFRGESLAQFLEQFPSDLIDRIEVIDNPGSEYDAEGTGGIVNIVLKEGVDLGLSGSVFANADTRGSTGLGGRVTAQRGDWVYNASGSLRRSDARSDAYRLRQNLARDPQDFVERDSWNETHSLGGSADLRATWTPREEARAWLRTNVSARGSERDGLVSTTHMDEGQDPFLRYDRSDLFDSDNRSLDLRSGFEWRWDARRHTVDVEARYTLGDDRRESRQEVLMDDGFDDQFDEEFELAPSEITLEDRHEDDRSIRFDLRYRRPLGESSSLRTGYSLRDDASENRRAITFIDGPGTTGTGDLQLRGFSRDQQFNSAYVTIQRTLTDGISLQGGLRAEHVAWDIDFPEATPISGRYFDVFPSVNLSWRLDGSRRLRLSYSQRIGRPGVNVLDPTDRSTDPLERSIGNPDIDPRYTHRVNLNGSWSGELGTLSLSPYVSRTMDGWERITTVDAQGVTTRSWDNLSSTTSTGGSVNLSLPRRADWRGSINLSASRTTRNADNLDQRYSGSFSSWRARANFGGPVPRLDGLTTQARLNYRAAGRNVQGRDGAQASVDMSFRYRFLENRASLNLSIRDPFGLQRTEREIRDLTVWEVSRNSNRARSAQISLSYALGGGGPRGGGGPPRGTAGR